MTDDYWEEAAKHKQSGTLVSPVSTDESQMN